MEKQIGLEVSELERIFAQIKKGKEGADAKLYTAYMPLIKAYAHQYHIQELQVNDLYNEVFTYLYNAIIKETMQPVNYTICFENILKKQCEKFKSDHANDFNSELLLRSYVQNLQLSEKEQEKREEKRAVAEQSLMYVTQILSELEHNPEFAKLNGLTEVKVELIEDFYGLNNEGKRLNLTQLAQKYNMPEARTQAVLITGLKKLRDMKEFAPIREQLRH